MTFHNLQNSLIYRLKTQEIVFQRLCISKFSITFLVYDIGPVRRNTPGLGPRESCDCQQV